MESQASEAPISIPKVNFEKSPNGAETSPKYSISDQEGQRIGDLMLMYYPRRREVEIGDISVEENDEAGNELRRRGYGLAVYMGIPGLSTPDGNRYTFVSSGQISDNAIRVWESLVRRGLAVQEDSGRYKMIDVGSDQKAA